MTRQVAIMLNAGLTIVDSLDILRNFNIPLPPFELQQTFAKLVQKVEALKSKQQESTKELDNLFNSLMQKAFKGELFNN